MKTSFIAAVIAAGTLPFTAYGYDVSTHATITQQAYQRSSLVTAPVSLFITLGIVGSSGVFPARYWDVSGQTERTRFVNDDPRRYELRILEKFGEPSTVSLMPRAWMMRGAIREDDIGAIVNPNVMSLFVDNPFDDPYNPALARPFHHFFDPANNSPLGVTFPGLSQIEPNIQKAPDWGLGFADSFASPLTIDGARRNHFTILDAREAMWRALTGLRGDGTAVGSDVTTRGAYWATTFRALGDTLHLLQDMAQPQHTRNDSHAGVPPLGPASKYEARVDDRATGKEFKRRSGGTTTLFTLPVLDFGSLTPVVFNKYSDYFSTSVRNVGAGKGMADYSNRGFFTIGTNLQANSYTLPSNNLNDYIFIDATGDNGRPITLIQGSVPDLVYASDPSVKLSAVSAWNDATTEAGGPQVFTLLPENYDEMARLLIPRAVAYSAGFINYFFRGSLNIQLPPEKVYAVADMSSNAGFSTFKVMVQNTTAPITPPGAIDPIRQTTSGQGRLVAVLRYRHNSCLQLPSLTGSPYFNPDGSGSYVWDESCRQPALAAQPLPDIIVSQPAGVPTGFDDALQPVIFQFPTPLPFNALDVDLQVIYRGPLGAEDDGIAVGFEQMNEPNFFNFDNNYDCFSDRQCPIGTADTACYITDSVKLPFPEAQNEAGWVPVARVSNLMPGQYARVGFLTRSAFREAPPANLEVVTNQNFPYEVDITFIPDGATETWPAGPTIRSPLSISRPLMGSQGSVSMLEWWGHGSYKIACSNGVCSQFAWASSCPAIDPTPQQATVMFP